MPGRRTGLLLILAATFLWGTGGSAARALFLRGMDPFLLVQLRLTLAFLLLVLALLWVRPSLLHVSRRDWPLVFLLGVLGMAMVQFTYLYTIATVGVGVAVFLQATAPLFVAGLAYVFLGEKLTLRGILAVVLALGGVYLLVGGEEGLSLAIPRVSLLSGLGSALFAAIYILLVKKGSARLHTLTLLTYGFGFGALFWWVVNPRGVLEHLPQESGLWFLILYLVIGGTVLPFGAFFRGLFYLRAMEVAILAEMEPIFASLIAYVTLREGLTLLQVGGAGLILGGVALVEMRRALVDRPPGRE